jgi:cell wall-associated NlpC family hydrolase
VIKILIGVAALVLLAPVGFVVMLAGPQAATESAGVATACRLVLGVAPQPDSTVEQLGGPDAVMVAAALTEPAATQPASDTAAPETTVAAVPADTVATLVGERAYAFVTTLNTLDNWRSLPVDTLARWAIDPPNVAPPAGAVPLPDLPVEQTSALQVDEQPATAYARGCAAVIGRATQIKVDPAGAQPGPAIVVDSAALAQMAGTNMANIDLLRAVNPGAAEDDPRQFYLNYRPVPAAAAGDIVVYDFTIAGPAHFGIALDEQQMLTTASFAGGVVQTRPVPANAGVMSATPMSADERKGTPS